MIRKVLHILAWVISLGGIITLLGFADADQKSQLCKNLNIRIDTIKGNFFVSEQEIKELIHDNVDSLKGKPLSDINISMLEKILKNDPYIQNAEVYSTINGEVVIDVLQRCPVVRIFSALNESYYIDELGNSMPLCDKYTSRVLVANGYIYENETQNESGQLTGMKGKIFYIADYIRKNPFWNALIEQIYVNQDSEFELIPKVGNQKILIGDTTALNEKFSKLYMFYKMVMVKSGWQKYSTLNLKFKNQVVCTSNEKLNISQ